MAPLSRPVAIAEIEDEIKEKDQQRCRQHAQRNQDSRGYGVGIQNPIGVDINQNADEWQEHQVRCGQCPLWIFIPVGVRNRLDIAVFFIDVASRADKYKRHDPVIDDGQAFPPPVEIGTGHDDNYDDSHDDEKPAEGVHESPPLLVSKFFPIPYVS